MPDHRRRQTGPGVLGAKLGRENGRRTLRGRETEGRIGFVEVSRARYVGEGRTLGAIESESQPEGVHGTFKAWYVVAESGQEGIVSDPGGAFEGRYVFIFSKFLQIEDTDAWLGSDGRTGWVIQSKRSEPNLRSRAEVRSQSVVVDPGHHNGSVINIHQKISSTRTRDDRIAREMRELELERIELEREQVSFYERKLRLERKQLKLEREQLEGERENARVAKLIELMELKQRVRSRWDMKKIEEVIESLL
ncbi:hypothetical protein C8R46DRAFT_1215494 [Mycena filopes]|nr:hypothetical protein C8R46DRAFT_1215494 [Mycena filopes]